jgi:hypothetical protein
MDKGRGDLCCTTVSTDLWTIDLPRPSNHKILLDTPVLRTPSPNTTLKFGMGFKMRLSYLERELALSFSAPKQSPRPPGCRACRNTPASQRKPLDIKMIPEQEGKHKKAEQPVKGLSRF